MNEDLAVLFAKRFIQRRDVKAVQMSNGIYIPDRELRRLGSHAPLGFRMEHLYAHLNGDATYGHYLLDQSDKCRFFALDIDLEKEGAWVPLPPYDANGLTDDELEQAMKPVECNPRELWQDRSALGARNWFKYQMSTMARELCNIIYEQLELPCAAAYSGYKGVHVYGFTGEMPASEARAAANLVLELSNNWKLHRGNHIFKHKIEDPEMGFPSFSLEVYPKQDSLEGKDLGNLIRLPLGRNLKSNDPTFFLDFTAPLGVLAPHADPVKLLDTGNPWL